MSLTVEDVAAACSVLGVGAAATERDVEVAYRKLAKAWHPDKASINGLSTDEAKERFQKIARAHEQLLRFVRARASGGGLRATSSEPWQPEDADGAAAAGAGAPQSRGARSSGPAGAGAMPASSDDEDEGGGAPSGRSGFGARYRGSGSGSRSGSGRAPTFGQGYRPPPPAKEPYTWREMLLGDKGGVPIKAIAVFFVGLLLFAFVGEGMQRLMRGSASSPSSAAGTHKSSAARAAAASSETGHPATAVNFKAYDEAAWGKYVFGSTTMHGTLPPVTLLMCSDSLKLLSTKEASVAKHVFNTGGAKALRSGDVAYWVSLDCAEPVPRAVARRVARTESEAEASSSSSSSRRNVKKDDATLSAYDVFGIARPTAGRVAGSEPSAPVWMVITPAATGDSTIGAAATTRVQPVVYQLDPTWATNGGDSHSFAQDVHDSATAALATARAQHAANTGGQTAMSVAADSTSADALPVVRIRSRVGFKNCLRRARSVCIAVLASSLLPQESAVSTFRRAFAPLAASQPRATLAVVDALAWSVDSESPLREAARAARKAAARRHDSDRVGDVMLVLRRVSGDAALAAAAVSEESGSQQLVLATFSAARTHSTLDADDIREALAAHQQAVELVMDFGEAAAEGEIGDGDGGAGLDPAAAAELRAARAEAAVERAVKRDEVLARTHSVVIPTRLLRVMSRDE